MYPYLHTYLRLFLRWAWLIFLVAILCGTAAYFIRTNQAPVYRASTKLMIGGSLQTSNPDETQITTSIQLTKMYSELVTTHEVLQATIDTYNLPLSSEQLLEMTQVVVQDETPFLEIVVTSNDPKLAAQIANGLAERLITLKSPNALLNETESQLELLKTEIAALNAQLVAVRVRVEEIDEQLLIPRPFNEVTQLTQERLALINQRLQLADILERLTGALTSQRQQSNTLEVINPAHVPIAPDGVNKWMVTILGALVGMLAGVGGVILWDEITYPIKTPHQVTNQLKVAFLGSIPRFNRRKHPLGLVAVQAPQSPAAAAYRNLQASLLLWHKPLTYVITSPNVDEGKSTTAANLAATLAQSGLRVLLVDANLTNPQLHRIFKLENKAGLVDLITKSSPITPSEVETLILPILQATLLPNLLILTRGTPEANTVPSNLAVRLFRVRDWLEVLQAQAEIEVVIFDTPPCLTSSESLILADSLPAGILMVLAGGTTRLDSTQVALQNFSEVGYSVKGVILNKS